MNKTFKTNPQDRFPCDDEQVEPIQPQDDQKRNS